MLREICFFVSHMKNIFSQYKNVLVIKKENLNYVQVKNKYTRVKHVITSKGYFVIGLFNQIALTYKLCTKAVMLMKLP